jgi:cytochrome c oxidase subunit 1
MGIVSEILPVFSRKPLFGYKAPSSSRRWASPAFGFSVWAHHMFTTGAVLKPFFGFMTFMIGVPTGVKIFNWLATTV